MKSYPVSGLRNLFCYLSVDSFVVVKWPAIEKQKACDRREQSHEQERQQIGAVNYSIHWVVTYFNSSLCGLCVLCASVVIFPNDP
jgi:hypothetical protein